MYKQKDYQVIVRIKNNVFLKTMEKYGFFNLSELSRQSGISLTTLTNVANLKIPVFQKRIRSNKKQKMHKVYEDLLKFFNCSIYELVPEQHFEKALEKTKIVKELDLEQIDNFVLQSQETPEKLLLQNEIYEKLYGCMDCLTEREKDVLKLRFEFNGNAQSYLDLAKKHNVTRERIRQIEAKALKKIRVIYKEIYNVRSYKDLLV